MLIRLFMRHHYDADADAAYLLRVTHADDFIDAAYLPCHTLLYYYAFARHRYAETPPCFSC